MYECPPMWFQCLLNWYVEFGQWVITGLRPFGKLVWWLVLAYPIKECSWKLVILIHHLAFRSQPHIPASSCVSMFTTLDTIEDPFEPI